MLDTPEKQTPSDLLGIERALHHLNYRWNREALALWRGEKAPLKAYQIYDGYDDLISLETLRLIETSRDGYDPRQRSRLKFALTDHYLQRELLPHETEMRTWMRGAAAIVDGQRIYFREVIPWCQKSSTYEGRQALQKETGPLCKFLKPFALNYWSILLEMLKNDFGFDNYIDFCRAKKGIDYPRYYHLARELLDRTDSLYFPAMERWSRNRFNRPLSDLTRFDAIKLLSLEQFDGLYPEPDLRDLLGFFRTWGMDPAAMPNLRLEIDAAGGKSAQGMSFFIRVPEEVHVLMRPQGGWLDLETLWHELGHGLSAALTSPDLHPVDRNMVTSYSLSEAFAFLLQRLVLSPHFLAEFLSVPSKTVEVLNEYRTLRDLAAFRRYAAKFVSEYEMFTRGDLENGESYGRLMARHTGFYHQPESHLFDLVPELYSLDYLLGWMGEAMVETHLRDRFGDRWMFRPETGGLLGEWWRKGNREDIFGFFKREGIGELSPEALLDRWAESVFL